MLSDYFDHVERELQTAVRRRAHAPWYVRLQKRRPRTLVVVLAALVIAGPALAAVGLLQSGSSVGPEVAPTPRAFNGVALQAGVRLLSLRVPDPAGGAPWGMRLIPTSRGLLCVQVGRVAFGTVGALGRDGAFHNDGRFHPFSPNYEEGPPCVAPDVHGHGFLNIASYGLADSALLPDRAYPGCEPAPSRGRILRLLNVRKALASLPRCRPGDLRDVYFGLLGPDATSITYRTTNGGLRTTPTVGTDGAYLLVVPYQGQRAHPGVSFGGGAGFTYDSRVISGVIAAVHYRDGHTCHVPAPGGPARYGSCPPVGYVTPAGPLPNPTQAASRVTVRVEPSKSYCVANPPSEAAIPCPGDVPRGFRRLDMSRAPEVLVVVSFVSRIPITNGQSYYYIQMSRAPYADPHYSATGEQCGGGNSDFGQTNSDYRKGQLVKQWFFENLNCRGPVHGDVSLVITTGPSAPAPTPAVAGQSVGRDVGHFSFTVP